MTNPIRPTDNEARTLAKQLMGEARFAALGTVSPEGSPLVTRVAFGLCPAGQPISLISGLSQHSQMLQANPNCSLLVGEPGAKGDPLTHPRISLVGRAEAVDNQGPEHAEMAAHYLHSHPKAKLYIGFADFFFVRFALDVGYLNGGFGKAFHLSANDLAIPG
ncbi:pyridoxamine 5'-phosphate oxidase family protein [Pseudophaeobacter sp.]|uniref:HugZ family pyridoxamine 5'-phosphate oxidase n=1 Tax=Pseudophaeobacter sp. TaxID=1971739 RepID=UPI003298317E